MNGYSLTLACAIDRLWHVLLTNAGLVQSMLVIIIVFRQPRLLRFPGYRLTMAVPALKYHHLVP